MHLLNSCQDFQPLTELKPEPLQLSFNPVSSLQDSDSGLCNINILQGLIYLTNILQQFITSGSFIGRSNKNRR